MTAIQLEQSIYQDIKVFSGDYDVLKQIKNYLTKKKHEMEVQKEHNRIMDSIQQGLSEYQMMQRGEIEAKPVEELLDEL